MRVEVVGKSIKNPNRKYYSISLDERELELILENIAIPDESGSKYKIEVKKIINIISRSLNNL
jgi:hypothetical protein